MLSNHTQENVLYAYRERQDKPLNILLVYYSVLCQHSLDKEIYF